MTGASTRPARLALALPSGSVVLASAWDGAGRRTGLTLPGSRTTSYVYDAAGALDSLTDWQGRPTEFDADGDGKTTAIRRPNGVRTAHGYDAAGRLTGVSHYAPGGGALAEFGYVLDANGNRTRLDVTGSAVANGAETYRYDSLDRLEEVTYANGDRAAYEYDANGNRTKLTTTPAGGQPLVAGYAYDAADQLESDGSLTYVHDASGNVTAAGTSTFAWDWRGRMAGATTGAGTTTYQYDGDGVRTGKTAGGATTPYLWDRAGGLPLLVGDGTQSYLHAGGGVLAGVDGAGAATWTLPDGLGSVRARADGTGAVIGTAAYDAFGTPRSSSGVTGTFGFAGEQADPETGQLHLRARQYAPGLGRFLAADPAFPAGPGSQGYGRYAYAANNPINWTDPSGRSPKSACAAFLLARAVNLGTSNAARASMCDDRSQDAAGAVGGNAKKNAVAIRQDDPGGADDQHGEAIENCRSAMAAIGFGLEATVCRVLVANGDLGLTFTIAAIGFAGTPGFSISGGRLYSTVDSLSELAGWSTPIFGATGTLPVGVSASLEIALALDAEGEFEVTFVGGLFGTGALAGFYAGLAYTWVIFGNNAPENLRAVVDWVKENPIAEVQRTLTFTECMVKYGDIFRCTGLDKGGIGRAPV